MVGPGEVDDDLQPETAEECTKYGEVVRCLIYEVSNITEHKTSQDFPLLSSMCSSLALISVQLIFVVHTVLL